ncbi:hypothetical protein RGQ29_030579 [Quercus rubra]|uniref:Uncharacterized protein n=1 Tax=Quercus rubra TaxID=3512 RepID=A0AAN7IEF3_QUERU|nr:hypothetical protein RGQ29_030579 [Quercus rubra]
MDRGVNMVSINGGLLMAPPHLTIKNLYLKGVAEMYEKWCICYCGPQVHCGFSHLQYASLKISNLMEDISASTFSSVATKMPLSLPTYYCHPLKLKPPLPKGLHWFWSSQFVLVLVISGSQYLFKDSSFHRVSISWLI